MKNKLLVFAVTCLASTTLLVSLAPVVLTTGCVSPGGAGTNVVNQGTIDATAVLLKGAAQAGALAAIQNDKGNAKYFELAADSISTFLTTTNYTPGAFQNALMGVIGNSGALTNAYVTIGIGTVIDLYQLYYGQYVKGQINGNAYAGEFLTAIQNGFYMALGKPIPLARQLKVVPVGCPLPRPIK